MTAHKGNETSKRYVMLEDRMTTSAAWDALSDGAIWCYIELRKSYDKSKGGNDHLTLSYRKAAWRKAPATFKKNMSELADRGFISLVEHGGREHKPNVYRLSNRWEEVSRKLVDKCGRIAIRIGLAKKLTHRNSGKNLQDYKKGTRS